MLAVLGLSLAFAGSASADTRKTQQIRCQDSFTVTYRSNYTFPLNAKASTTRSYKSGNTSVATVSSAGVVTVKGCGVATITITAKSTSKYQSAKKNVAVYVKPAAPTITLLQQGQAAGTFTVSWTKDAKASGYQIQYSMNKNFSDSKKIKVTSPNTFSKSISTGHSGGLFYVRVQSYKKAGGKNLFGPFSTTRVVTVKALVSQKLTISPSPVLLKTGESRKLTVSGAKTSLSYSISDSSVATVDSSGRVVGKKIGHAVVTVKAKATSRYFSATAKVTVTVAGNLVSEAQMKAALSSKGRLGLWYCADYDADGTKEGFAITLDPNNEIKSLYYVDSYGKVSELLRSGPVSSDTYLGVATLDSNGSAYCYFTMGGKGFYYVNYNGSGTGWGERALLFGVRNGKPYELNLSKKISGFYMENGETYTIRHILNPYHVYMKQRLIYDSDTGQFILGEDLGEVNW